MQTKWDQNRQTAVNANNNCSNSVYIVMSTTLHLTTINAIKSSTGYDPFGDVHTEKEHPLGNMKVPSGFRCALCTAENFGLTVVPAKMCNE